MRRGRQSGVEWRSGREKRREEIKESTFGCDGMLSLISSTHCTTGPYHLLSTLDAGRCAYNCATNSSERAKWKECLDVLRNTTLIALCCTLCVEVLHPSSPALVFYPAEAQPDVVQLLSHR